MTNIFSVPDFKWSFPSLNICCIYIMIWIMCLNVRMCSKCLMLSSSLSLTLYKLIKSCTSSHNKYTLEKIN